MKGKARLQGFSSIEDDIEPNNNQEVPRHHPTTYEGICNREDTSGDSYCHNRARKCLHGIYDQGNLNRNIKLLDQYYVNQMSTDVDFDERFFINHNGLAHTPIKLISPINYYSGSSGKALKLHSSTAGHKSPLAKSAMAAHGH